MAAQFPTEFDGYRLRRKIGEGGMGEVHLAEDTVLERAVAIKLISASQPDATTRERFMVEARAIARLQHPNVVSVYRVGEVSGVPYLVSEFVEGRPLDELPRPIDAATARRIAMDLAHGLAAAHRRGVVHRDIKPANAIVAETGEIKLLDFGIAKLMAPGARSSPAALTGNQTATEPPAAPRAPCRLADPGEVTAATRDLRGRRAEPVAVTAATRDLRGLPDAAATEETEATRPTMAPRPKEGAPSPVAPVRASLARLTQTGAALGTPRYMAPEIWRGEPATCRSDVYSFGALLYSLCADRAPHPAATLDELRHQVQNRQIEPLAAHAPDQDPALCAVVDRCLCTDPADRFASGGELRAEIAKLMPGARTGVVPRGNPYRGLSCFETEHRGLYFGRDSETRMILDRLVSDPFVLVAGDSGVGKSSLCRAGVLSRLDDWLGAERSWTHVTVVPGRHPVTALAAAFALVLGRDENDLAAQIMADPAGVARQLRAQQGNQRGVVLFIDQLEELVTISEPEEAATISETLGWLAVPAPGTRLLASVRGDFLPRVADLPRLGDEVTRALYFLRPLSAERIRDAVVGPARVKGVSFESEQLVDELVATTADAGAGGLPLLQFALAALWDARAGAAQITRATLAAVGGVTGALSQHADDVLAQMLPAERRAARHTLMRLVTSDGTRTSHSAAELAVGDPSQEPALAALVRGRLLVARDTPRGSAYEIAHEALISGWETLANWLSADINARRLTERLRAAVTEWQRLGRAREGLWSRRQVAELETVEPGGLSEGERAFLSASRRALRHRRAARVLLAAAVPLVVLLSYGALTWRQQRALDEEITSELTAATQLHDQARAARRQAEVLRVGALSLFDEPDLPAAEAAWAQYLEATAALRPRFGAAAQRLERALLKAGSRRDVQSQLADVLYEQAELAELSNDEARTAELLDRLTVHDTDGVRARRWQAPARLTLRTTPAHGQVKLSRFELDGQQRYVAKPVATAGGPLVDAQLPPGSYLAVINAPERAPVRYPVLLRRGETVSLDVELPPAGQVPAGFVYVPPGRFLMGSAADERQRRDFFHTVPIHRVETPGFLIARHETTFAQWIAYLETLPEDGRQGRLPRVGKGGFKGALRLARDDDGAWRLTFQPTTVEYSARAGEPIVYRDRQGAATQDWLKLPVIGIAAADAEHYVDWLARSGTVPRARLCTEREWERAARGSDGRPFPHGLRLAPGDANHDATYGQRPAAMGPNEVGTHSATRSPFGIYDMAGNVWEWTRSDRAPNGYAARGGSWYFGASSARTEDREETEPSFRDLSVGMRVCADLPPRAHARAH